MRTKLANAWTRLPGGIGTFYKWSSSALVRPESEPSRGEASRESAATSAAPQAGAEAAAPSRPAASAADASLAEAWMHTDVSTCRADTSMEEAASLMWASDCGCLPVLDGEGKLEGLVTDRDICMAAFTQGKSLGAMPVRTAMKPRVPTCLPSEPVARVLRVMNDRRVHDVPIVDEDGRLRGIVSLADLARKACTRAPAGASDD